MEEQKGLLIEKQEQGSVAPRREYQVRLAIEKLKGEDGYRRCLQASTVTDGYHGVAVLIRDMAEATEQPVDHVLAVLATILLAPRGDVS